MEHHLINQGVNLLMNLVVVFTSEMKEKEVGDLSHQRDNHV